MSPAIRALPHDLVTGGIPHAGFWHSLELCPWPRCLTRHLASPVWPCPEITRVYTAGEGLGHGPLMARMFSAWERGPWVRGEKGVPGCERGERGPPR